MSSAMQNPFDRASRGLVRRAGLAMLCWLLRVPAAAALSFERRWREVAELETDPVRKADLAMLVIFAQLTERVEEWKKALEGFNVMKSVILEEYKAEGRTEGLLTGLAAVLSVRFAQSGLALMGELRTMKDPARLEAILGHARTAATLDDFRRDAGL